MLMAVKPKSKTAIYQILNNTWIQIINLCWRPFRVVMPNSDSQWIVVHAPQLFACLSDAIGVDGRLSIEGVVVVATTKANHHNP